MHQSKAVAWWSC